MGYRKTRTVYSERDGLLELHPLVKLGNASYTLVIPKEWVGMWLDEDDPWVTVEDADPLPGFIIRPGKRQGLDPNQGVLALNN